MANKRISIILLFIFYAIYTSVRIATPVSYIPPLPPQWEWHVKKIILLRRQKKKKNNIVFEKITSAVTLVERFVGVFYFNFYPTPHDWPDTSHCGDTYVTCAIIVFFRPNNSHLDLHKCVYVCVVFVYSWRFCTFIRFVSVAAVSRQNYQTPFWIINI